MSNPAFVWTDPSGWICAFHQSKILIGYFLYQVVTLIEPQHENAQSDRLDFSCHDNQFKWRLVIFHSPSSLHLQEPWARGSVESVHQHCRWTVCRVSEAVSQSTGHHCWVVHSKQNCWCTSRALALGTCVSIISPGGREGQSGLSCTVISSHFPGSKYANCAECSLQAVQCQWPVINGVYCSPSNPGFQVLVFGWFPMINLVLKPM